MVRGHNLTRLVVANGTRLLDEGDWFGALLWFAEGLQLDRDNPDRERTHRNPSLLPLITSRRSWSTDLKVQRQTSDVIRLRTATLPIAVVSVSRRT